MKKTIIGVSGRIWLLLVATLFTSQQVWAFSNGVSGRSQSSNTCNACHGGGSFSSSITVSGDSEVAPGSSNNYTIILNHTASIAGFNLSTTNGSLSATDSGTRLASSELTHSSPRSGSSGSTQWTFQWTAPSSGSNTFSVCGNPSNGNGSTSGDESNTPCTTFAITVASNSAPTANNDSASVDEDANVNIDVLSNDSDSDGTLDTTSVTIVSGVSNGSTSINSSTGVVTYTPDANFNGSDSFTYTVNDNEGATSNTATVSITVNSVNDSPTASNDSATTSEDTAVTISVLSNDSDSDGTLNNGSISITSGPSNGSTSINSSDGTVTYTPSSNFNGNDSFTYTVQDNEGGTSNVASVNITINAVNDAPVAVNDSSSTDEDNAVTIDVLSNDSDVDSSLDSSSLKVTSPPANGSATISSSSFIYTPNADFNGVDTFTYTVNDTSGATSNTATVSITVNSVNDAPVASDDSATTAEDTAVTISLLANDSDVDGSLNNSSISILTDVSNGTTSVNTSDGTVTYTPSNGFNGNDSFTYRVSDNDGAASNTATVSITVTEVNDSPVAQDDSAVTDEDNAVTINVVANDSDADGTIDSDTVAVASSPSNGSTSISSGNITYTPNADFNGSDSFTYTVNDDKGASSNAATVTITINSVNDAPVASNDSITIEVNENGRIDVLANDSDVDGTLDTATVTIVANPSNGSTSINTSDGSITYTPTADFAGSDSFTYTVNDNEGETSNTATVSVTVRRNEAPVAADDSATTDEDNAVTISVLTNDTDDLSIDSTSVAIVQQPSSGSASANSDGTVTYTPNANSNGADSFTYTVNDNQGATSNTATVNITVNAVNDAPIFTSSPVTSVTQNHNYEYTVTTSDVENDTVSLQLTTDQNWLSLSGNVVSGVPPLEAIGAHSITLTASDGNDSTEQVYTLTVTPRTDADIAVSVSFSPTPATISDGVMLTYTITNNGPADASNVKLSGDVSGNFDSMSTPENCSNDIDCTISSLALNDSVELTFMLSLSSATDLFATGEVSFEEDLTDSNNMASNSTSVASVYSARPTGSEGANSRSVVTGDIDGDGFADAIFINGNGENNQVFRNTGSGQLTLHATINDGLDGAAGTLFDFDGDSDLDLIVANCSGHANQLYLNDGGNFTLQQELGNADSRAVVVMDFNNDGMPDLAFANADGANTVYTKSEDGNYVLAASLQGQAGPAHSLGVVSADLNGDGFNDIAFANGDGGNNVYFNMMGDTSEFGFDQAMALGSSNSNSVALVDADSDGTMDIVFANSSSNNAQSAPANILYINDGNKGFSGDVSLGLVNTRHVKTGDFNGDGQMDLFFVNGHGSHQIYSGDGAGTFNLNARGYYNPNAISATPADLDNDGDHDILFADSQNKQTSMMLNDGNGELSQPSVDVSVQITAPQIVNAGDSIDLSVQLNNSTANLIAQDILLMVMLPDSFTMTSSATAGCELSGQTYTCAQSSLSDSAVLFPLQGTTSIATGMLIFNATVVSSTPEIDSANNTANTTVVINGIPQAADDTASVQTGNTVTIDVLANDSDDGTLSGVTVVDAPSNGTATVNENGSIDYAPNTDFTGSDSFTYTVMDDQGITSNTATVAITVTAVPTPPTQPPSSGGGGGGSLSQWLLLGLLLGLNRRRLTDNRNR